jgi:hypothetical protein
MTIIIFTANLSNFFGFPDSKYYLIYDGELNRISLSLFIFVIDNCAF